jgi:hypothetical protein
MKTMVVSVVIVSFALTSAESRADVLPVGVPPPNSLSVGGQYYDASVSGVRQFVENFKDSDPDVYAKLSARADRLEAMKTRGWIVGITTAVVGIGFVVGGFALYKPNVPPGQTPNTTPILVGAVVGMPLIIASSFVGRACAPSRSDYMDFVNYNNKINPSSPLRWQLGWTSGGPTMALSGSFDLL